MATGDRQHANDADAHDEEIEAVPGLSQVWKLVENEAKTDDFDNGFNDEDYGEDQVNLLLDGRPVRLIIWLQTFLVIGWSEHDWVKDDG